MEIFVCVGFVIYVGSLFAVTYFIGKDFISEFTYKSRFEQNVIFKYESLIDKIVMGVLTFMMLAISLFILFGFVIFVSNLGDF